MNGICGCFDEVRPHQIVKDDKKNLFTNLCYIICEKKSRSILCNLNRRNDIFPKHFEVQR